MKDFKFLLSKVTENEDGESDYETIEGIRTNIKNEDDLTKVITKLAYTNGLRPVNVEIIEENSQYYQAWFDFEGKSYLVEIMGKGYD